MYQVTAQKNFQGFKAFFMLSGLNAPGKINEDRARGKQQKPKYKVSEVLTQKNTVMKEKQARE